MKSICWGSIVPIRHLKGIRITVMGVDPVRQKGGCNWGNLRRQPKTASYRFPPLHRAVTRRGLNINSLLFQRIAIEARHECLVGVPNVKFRDAFPRSLRPSRYSLGG